MSDNGIDNMAAIKPEGPSMEALAGDGYRRIITTGQKVKAAVGVIGFGALAVFSGAGDVTAEDDDKIAPGAELSFGVSGNPGDVAFVNLTPVNAESAGHGRLLGGDADPPESDQSSNVNFRPGSVDPNVGLAPISVDGKVKYQNGPPAGSRVDLVADHLFTLKGEYITLAQPSGTPQRKVDTRIGLGGGTFSEGEKRCFEVAGDVGDAAIVNLTPVNASGFGHGRLVGSDVILAFDDVSSNVNFGPGTVDPNLAFAPIGEEGVCFENSDLARVDLVADHLATIDGSVVTWAQDSSTPRRTIDTRSGNGGGTLNPGERRSFSVAGEPGDLAVVNLTPVLAKARGHGRLISSDVYPPESDQSSNVNYGPGTVDPNVGFAPIGADGAVVYENGNVAGAKVELVGDHLLSIANYAITLAQPSGAPLRPVDTRNGVGVVNPGVTPASEGITILRAGKSIDISNISAECTVSNWGSFDTSLMTLSLSNLPPSPDIDDRRYWPYVQASTTTPIVGSPIVIDTSSYVGTDGVAEINRNEVGAAVNEWRSLVRLKVISSAMQGEVIVDEIDLALDLDCEQVQR